MNDERRDPAGYRVVPFPLARRRITDFLRLMHKKHVVHALIEVDVTDPRRSIGEWKAAHGQPLSFTAFVIGCLAKAVDEDSSMQAYRKGRRRLVLFDDVDVATLIEHEIEGKKIATPHVFRGANKKSLLELHHEMREVQQRKRREFTRMPLSERLFFSLPGPVRTLVFGLVQRSPRTRKRIQGTVLITAVGMFGKAAGWGIPMTVYTLTVTLGGIAPKPWVVDGRVEPRDILSATISVDHDIIDGAPLARFASRFSELIESGHGLASGESPSTVV